MNNEQEQARARSEWLDPPADPLAEVAPGLFAQRHAPWTEQVGGYDVELVLVLDGDRYVCRHVEITQRPDGPPVTGEAIRAIPIGKVIKNGIASMADALFSGGEVEDGGVRLTRYSRPPEGTASNGPTAEALTWVARIYARAALLGEPPTRAVEQALGLPRSTAGRWISLARSQGLIDRPPAKAYPGRGTIQQEKGN